MALQCVCDKGHVYIQADVYRNWSVGEPVCPECHIEWLELQVLKGKVRMAGNETGIRVYADETGIGIYDKFWEDDWGAPIRSDLRLNDVKAFLDFMHKLLVIAADKGWLPVDAMSK